MNITEACPRGVCEPHVNSKEFCNIRVDNVTFLYNKAGNASSINQINYIMFNYVKDLLFRVDNCFFSYIHCSVHHCNSLK
jgi:hypothetical protein